MNAAALIYSHSISPRLQYVADFLSNYYGHSFNIISDKEKYRTSDFLCKINYSHQPLLAEEIFIYSNELLFDISVRPVSIECFNSDINRPDGYNQQHGYKAFFKTAGDFEFDILAAIFFLLSRYEEYLPHKKDEFGRYPHQESLAFREGFLQLPLINIWLEDFRLLVSSKNPQFQIPKQQFQLIATYDIDMAWSYKNKGFLINAGNFFKSILHLKFDQALNRVKTIQKKTKDPFDSYEWMEELHSKYDLKPIYFFLVAIKKGKHDKNINVRNENFRQLIKSIVSKSDIGLHPSWASGDDHTLLKKEKELLEQISGKEITSSRQHFIRMELPTTYQKLLQTGIQNDHSMGYGSINGFRASYAGRFQWYDLKNERQTDLTIHPFCFMDSNAYYEQKLTAEEGFAEMKEFYEVIKSVNGTMITLWHNSFLGTAKEFVGWKEVYEKFVAYLKKEMK